MQIHLFNKYSLCALHEDSFLDSIGCGLLEGDLGVFKGRFGKKVKTEITES